LELPGWLNAIKVPLTAPSAIEANPGFVTKRSDAAFEYLILLTAGIFDALQVNRRIASFLIKSLKRLIFW